MILTKGDIENQISEAVIRFAKEYMGRGPLETKTSIIEDMILVRLKGVLTPAEQQLAKGGENSSGRRLIKEMRIALLEKGRPVLESSLENIVSAKVVSLHADISTRTGENIMIFVLDRVLVFEGKGKIFRKALSLS